MPLSQEVISMRENGLLTDEDLTKLASVEANMLEASSDDLEALVSTIADALRAEGFDQEDFMKAAQLIESDGVEFDVEKLAAKVLNISKYLPSTGALLETISEGIVKHKAKIAPAFLAAMTLALGAQAITGTKAQQTGLQKSLTDIKAQYPELKADKMTDQHFEALSTFSPSIAQSPVVAGNLLLKMKQWGSIDHKTVQDLIQMERGLQEAKAPPMGLSDIVRTTGGIHQLTMGGKTTIFGTAVG